MIAFNFQKLLKLSSSSYYLPVLCKFHDIVMQRDQQFFFQKIRAYKWSNTECPIFSNLFLRQLIWLLKNCQIFVIRTNLYEANFNIKVNKRI